MADSPISGQGYTVGQLFSNHRFKLDYYQREYTWSRDEVRTLLTDLHRRFEANWQPDHGRQRTASYSPYFLGPFVYFEQEDVTYLVDGQQRVTTLHLLLLHVQRLLLDLGANDDAGEISRLAVKNEFGTQTFTIDIEERSPLLKAIHAGKPYTLPAAPMPSVRNLYQRSLNLIEDFPSELRNERLPYFLDWLRNRVCLVGIKALGRDSGWEIFETMNDRGSQLPPLDLLKSFLLSRADSRHAELNRAWREMLSRLSTFGNKVPSDFVKTLLVARYADIDDPSERDTIERSFHEWVRQNGARLGLSTATDYQGFVEETICRLADRYATLIQASTLPNPGLEHVYYNAVNGLGPQLTLILAALQPSDSDEIFHEKARLISAFVDLVYVRRHVGGNAAQPGNLDAEFHAMLPRLRVSRSLDSLKNLLSSEIAALDDDFAGLVNFGLRSDNRPQVRYLLARLTTFVEVGVRRPDRIAEYLDTERPFEIEHIWANKFERFQHLPRVKTQLSFKSWRNRLGALLLLHKSDNASYQADAYSRKIDYYRGQNTLAASLHPAVYEKNPLFSRFRKEQNLEAYFRPYPTDMSFDTSAIENRQLLYRRICEMIWDPEGLGFNVPKTVTAERRISRRTRARYDVSPEQLLGAGLVQPGEPLIGKYKGVVYRAVIEQGGKIRVESGELFGSLSSAGMFVLDRQSLNGWDFWKVKRAGSEVTMKAIRNEALERGLFEN